MDIRLLDPNQPAWPAQIDELYRALGGPANATLFPLHFLQVALPQIGGRVVVVEHSGALRAGLFLFPRRSASASSATSRAYTLRVQAQFSGPPLDLTTLSSIAATIVNAPVTVYDPSGDLHFAPTHQLVNGIDIGQPDGEEANAIRTLQQQVWGSPPASLYPADIHSTEFGLGSSLVARVVGRPVGFLFGFIKFGGHPLPADWQERFAGRLRIESQLLGVLPEQRGARLGFLLKRTQAANALRDGIQLINWTVDPLQWPNAVLNFGLLRAIAFDFASDYYPFRNALNRVSASRFSLTWLVNTQRVRSACGLDGSAPPTGRPLLIDLAHAPEIERVNQAEQILTTHPTAPQIALELPANWTVLQSDDLAHALRWRATTDDLFQRLVGRADGQYVVTDVGVDGARRYLVAQRANPGLWAQLGSSALA